MSVASGFDWEKEIGSCEAVTVEGVIQGSRSQHRNMIHYINIGDWVVLNEEAE